MQVTRSRQKQSRSLPYRLSILTNSNSRPRFLRPSLDDYRFKGDAWIADEGNGMLAVRLGDYLLTEIAGLTVDVPTLNHLFGRLRKVPRR